MIENSEKELLKEDLENQGTPEAINKFIEDAELLGHEDIAELGRKKLQEISEKAKSIETTSESQASSVESMGGTGEEVTERTKEVDSKIEEVKTEAVKQIEEVKKSTEVAKENEIVGENYPITLDYVGKHFKEETPSHGVVDYQITGKVMLRKGTDSGVKDLLTVPISWGNFRSVDWRNDNKPVLYEETEGYEKFQTIEQKVFFDPDTKDLYWIDSVGNPRIKSQEMVSMMEEAYSKLKNQADNEKIGDSLEFKYNSEEGRKLRNSLSSMSEEELIKVMDKYPYSVSPSNDNKSLLADIIRVNKLSADELIKIDKKINNKEGYNDELIVGRILETGKLPLDKALEIVLRGGGPGPMDAFVRVTNFSNMNDTDLKKVFKILQVVGNWHFDEILKKSGRTKEQVQALLK